ncbi:MAG TPA: DUF3592 domain-containing protein [Ktedonobacteraceae bacterium]|nr:DUF3592 domain-containing protein [Ktedonobacteraceae bacterium]
MFSRQTENSTGVYPGWPQQPRSRALLLLGEIVVLLIAALIPAWGGFYRADYYSRFVQGTCTIISGAVTSDYHHTKNGGYTTYAPTFTYTVAVPGTSGVYSSGYQGPDRASFSARREAQNIVKQYAVGTTMACWYNPANPQEAFLLFQGYSQARAWIVFGGAFFLTGLAQLVTLLVWYHWVRKFLILRERGQMTRGLVIRHETRRSNNSSYIVAIIEYTGIAFDQRPMREELTGPGHLSLRSQVPVCYDPYRPGRARCGSRPTGNDICGAIFATLLLLVALTGIACLITFLAA